MTVTAGVVEITDTVESIKAAGLTVVTGIGGATVVVGVTGSLGIACGLVGVVARRQSEPLIDEKLS